MVFLSFQASPADDPVLRSFSSAISHDILCAWRRSPQIGSQSSSDSGSLSSAKELWVFWFGDDPNLQGIVSAELKGNLLSSSSVVNDFCPTVHPAEGLDMIFIEELHCYMGVKCIGY